MNPYVIAPNVSKITIDPELAGRFDSLNEHLGWRSLTTNLESCEESPYLYFRITLKLRPSALTYAGFSTGAPFMLTRDKDVKKRAFFLRHWVRKVPPGENANAPLVVLRNMSVAVKGEKVLVRVDIDRPLIPRDTFKSIPFATWMFQVVEVDALIQGAPGIRFAFAIERTVTPEERELVVASRVEVRSKGPKGKTSSTTHISTKKTAPAVSSTPHRAQPLHTTVRPARPLQPMSQPSVPTRPTMAYNSMTMRPSVSYNHNPYAFASTRQIAPGMRQNVAPRSQYVSQQSPKVPPRGYSRSTTNQPASSVLSGTESLRPVMHPYLRMWEDRDLDDPYEPIFVAEDEEFEKRSKRTWVVEHEGEHAERFKYENLFGLPSANYPPYFFMGPRNASPDGEPDIEITVHRKKRAKKQPSQANGLAKGEGLKARVVEDTKYSAAVVAAAEYNSILRNDRSELRRWLEEDGAREARQSDREDEDDEGDGDSSD